MSPRSSLSLRAKIALVILLVSACAITAGGLVRRSMARLEEASDWTDHTFTVLVALEELEADLNRLETDQRGFLLTGDANYLEPHDRSIESIGRKLAMLRDLIADNSLQRQHMERLGELVPARIAVLNRTLDVYKQEGQAAAIRKLKTNEGMILMRNVHGVLDDMRREENRLLLLRRSAEENSRQVNNSIILASVVATLAFLGVIALLIQDDLVIRGRLRETVEHMALTDALTGLPNRLAFNAQLEAALARAIRNQRKLAVLYFDVDGFKAINDRYGHLAGDQVLQQVARRVGALLRASDTVARLGGDEFIALIDEIATHADAGIAASKIIDAVSQPLELGGVEGQVTASLGISLFPGDGARPEQLIHLADGAMYQAKRAGKATFRFCTRPDAQSS